MINWKVRFKNKLWLTTFIFTIIAFIYQVLGMFDIVPPVSENAITQVIGYIINILVAIGVVVDPTTSGVSDSELAMTYTKPKE